MYCDIKTSVWYFKQMTDVQNSIPEVHGDSQIDIESNHSTVGNDTENASSQHPSSSHPGPSHTTEQLTLANLSGKARRALIRVSAQQKYLLSLKFTNKITIHLYKHNKVCLATVFCKCMFVHPKICLPLTPFALISVRPDSVCPKFVHPRSVRHRFKN